MEPIPCWIVTALGLPNQDVDFYYALLRLIRNAFLWPSSGPITIINKDGELSIVVDPDFIQAGPGLTVLQNSDGTFTISALPVPGVVVGDTTTIVTVGSGTAADPFLPSLRDGALIGAGSTTVTQNPDGTFTIDTTLTPTSVGDSTTVSHTGSGTALDPYVFSLTPTSLVGTGGTTVTQNPDGTFTIDSSTTATSVTDTDTVVHSGTGTALDPYAFSLAAGALEAGPGISVSQGANGVYTIASAIAALVFGDTATIDVSGTGTVGDPYLFSFAPNSILAGPGVSVSQAVDGVYTISSAIAALVFGDTPTVDVNGTGTVGDPYLFSFASNSILAGTGIAVVQNPDGTFTISNTETAPTLADTATINVGGTGSVVDPYTFTFAPGSITAGTGIAVVQNPDGTYTITNAALVFNDTPTIDVDGTGTAVDPYVFSFAANSILAGTGIAVVQNPDGTYTITNSAPDIAPSFSSSDTIDLSGTGSVVDPYAFSLSATALLPGTDIAVTQDPVTKAYTISSSAAALIFGDSATNVVTGSGTVVDPYLFTFAPNSILAGAGIAVAQGPNGVFTITATGTQPILADSTTIDVQGDGSAVTPYVFALTPGALTAGTGISVVQNLDGTFTVTNSSPLSDLTLTDTATIDVSGSGTLVDPYAFAFAAGSLLAGTGIGIVQNPNGTFTITNTSPAPAPLIFSDSDTIDVSGTGEVGTPYIFALTAGALLAGAGISVSQNPNGSFTVSSTAVAPLFGDSATNVVSGSGTVGDPYIFTFAPNSVVAGAGISVTQAADGTFTISSTAEAPVLSDTPTIDVSGSGTVVDPYLFSLTAGAVTAGPGIVVTQNPDDSFTITNSSPLTDLTLGDTPTIDVSGSGTAVDPYLFAFAVNSLLAGTGIGVVQNPNGTFTISNTQDPTSLISTPTVTIAGDGSVLTPYEASLAAGALLAGTGISLSQGPNGVYTITNSSPLTDLTLGDTATIDISGSGTAVDPYLFAFAANSLLAGTGISLVQNPNGTFTITNSAPAGPPLVLSDTPTIDVSGTGTVVDPYLFAFAANSILAGAGMSVVQNPNGTFTIASTAVAPILVDSDTIDVSGDGSVGTPYSFALTAGALLAGSGIGVVQNPDGTFTISSTAVAPLFQDTATIDVSGDGSVLTPYEFALTAGALISGTGISVVQNPDGTFTITNSAPAGPALVFGNSATNVVSGDGSVGTPYIFTFASGSITAGTGIGVVQNGDGTYTISSTAVAPVLQDTATIDVGGDGSVGTPYTFSLTAGALVAGTGISLAQAGNGVYTITNSSPASGLVFGNSATNVVGGNGTVGTPYTFTFAANSILAGAGISVSQAGNGVFTIANTGLLQFWTEAYNATQDITSWNAVDNSIAAFKNIRAFTTNRIITGTIAASSMGADAVDLHQGNAFTQTAVAANSGIFVGLRNSITVAGTSSTIAGGTDHVINSATCFIGSGTFHTIAVGSASSGVVSGTSNKVTGSNSAILGGNANEIQGGSGDGILAGSTNIVPSAATNSAVLAGANNGNPTAGIVWTRCLVGAGTGNRIGTGSVNAVVLTGDTNSATGTGAVILNGTTNTVSGTGLRNTIVTGINNQIVSSAVGERDNLVGAGSGNVINRSSFSNILGGTNNIMGTVAQQLALGCSIVCGGSNTFIGTAASTSCAILCGGTNTINSLIALPTENSSILSGNLVVITASNTHNIASMLGRTNSSKKAIWSIFSAKPKPKSDPCRVGISGSAAGGTQVLMQSSHSFAMGNQVRVGSGEYDAQGSLTAGSYLENTKKHSTLIGSYGTSSTASQYEVLGVCSGTYTDPKTLMSVTRSQDGRGSLSTDTLMSSGSTVSYLFPKSPNSFLEEDDVGYFVSLDAQGNVSRCTANSRPIGVTVPRTGIILNSQDIHWHGKYKTDDFDRPVTRVSYVDSFLDKLALITYDPIPPMEVPECDETLLQEHRTKVLASIESIKKRRHDASVSLHEALLTRDGEDLVEWAIATYGNLWPELLRMKGTVLEPKQVPVISPEYNATLPYTPRVQRVKEWVPVVQKGVVKVRAEASCTIGALCTIKDGLATASEKGWLVLAKKNNVITIMLD